VESDGDEFGGFEIGPQEAEMMEFSASQSTPTRKAVKTSDVATPSRVVKNESSGLQTPVTGNANIGRSEFGGSLHTPSSSFQGSVEKRAVMGKIGYAVTDDVLEVLKGKVDA
jgi:hypothetical protein